MFSTVKEAFTRFLLETTNEEVILDTVVAFIDADSSRVIEATVVDNNGDKVYYTVLRRDFDQWLESTNNTILEKFEDDQVQKDQEEWDGTF